MLRFDLRKTSETVWLDGITLCETPVQPPPPAPQPVSSACQVVNGDFENGLTGWSLQSSAPAQAQLFSGDGARSATSARIAIAAGSAGGKGVSLSQNGVPSSGGWLSLALYARASNAQALTLALKSGDAMLWEQGLTLPAAANDSAFRQYFFKLSTTFSAHTQNLLTATSHALARCLNGRSTENQFAARGMRWQCWITFIGTRSTTVLCSTLPIGRGLAGRPKVIKVLLQNSLTRTRYSRQSLLTTLHTNCRKP